MGFGVLTSVISTINKVRMGISGDVLGGLGTCVNSVGHVGNKRSPGLSSTNACALSKGRTITCSEVHCATNNSLTETKERQRILRGVFSGTGGGPLGVVSIVSRVLPRMGAGVDRSRLFSVFLSIFGCSVGSRRKFP